MREGELVTIVKDDFFDEKGVIESIESGFWALLFGQVLVRSENGDLIRLHKGEVALCV